MSQVQAMRTGVETSASTGEVPSHSQGRRVQDKWKACLTRIRQEIPVQSFQTWFDPIIPVSFINDILLLRVPSQFFFDWIDSHYGDLLRRVVADVFGASATVEFLIAPSREERVEIPPAGAMDPAEEVPATPPITAETEERQCDVDHEFGFDNFFVGEENRLARKVAEHVAQHPRSNPYNPLFIHGPAGTGKTHLLYAVEQHVRRHHPGMKGVIMSADRFMREYVHALQSNQMERFLARLLAADLFLLDDLQCLEGKERTQENLLFVLSELLKRKRQILLTCDRSPVALTRMNPRLIALFQNGLIVDILPCEHPTREKIIRHQLERHEVELEEKIVQFLAEHLSGNAHHLMAVMTRIAAQVSLLGKPMTLNEVRYIVAQMCPGSSQLDGVPPAYHRVTIDDIINATSQFFGVPADILQGVSRKKRIVRARQVAIYLSRELTGESLASIGYHFSNLHHASVLHACKKIQEEQERDPRLKAAVQKIRHLLAR
ncbi:MAG: chromosomal replication initiator protein DnaA [Calditrichaeota bacterium]|nr:MAG: chromosomal replication initiator protein DnaA [Calditrichota bacterium]